MDKMDEDQLGHELKRTFRKKIMDLFPFLCKEASVTTYYDRTITCDLNKETNTEEFSTRLGSSAMNASTTMEERKKGYSKSIFVSDKTVDQKYCCRICKLILNNPYQSACGHRFCKECVLQLIRETTTQDILCPACVEEDEEDDEEAPDHLTEETVYPDKAILRELGKKQVRCINEGCNWKDTFRGYQRHESECAFRRVACGDCGEWLLQKNLEHHRVNECSHRIVVCKHCQEQYPFYSEQGHEANCPRWPVPCKDCSKVMPREEVPMHQDGECEMAVRPCDFATYGCDIKVSREQQAQHEKESVVLHLKFLQEYVQELDNKLKNSANNNEIQTLKRKVSELMPMINDMTLTDNSQRTPITFDRSAHAATASRHSAYSADSVPEEPHKDGGISSKAKESSKGAKRKKKQSSTKEQVKETEVTGSSGSGSDAVDPTHLEALRQQAQTFSDVSQVLKREVEQMRARTDTLERQKRLDQDQTRSLEQKIAMLERQLQGKDQVLSQLTASLQAAENVSYNGILTWKISEVARRRREAQTGQVLSLFSPPFFTSPTGYKMCARIYLNGDGMGNGSHVSLFFAIMKGNYDAILPWPFKQKVTLMILDQNRRENATDRFRPDPTTSSFSRPTENMNVASGCPLFLPLSSLQDPTRGLVKDDVLFVRIEVDTSELL